MVMDAAKEGGYGEVQKKQWKMKCGHVKGVSWQNIIIIFSDLEEKWGKRQEQWQQQQALADIGGGG